MDVAVAVSAMDDYGPFGAVRLDRSPPTHRFGDIRVDVLPFGGVERSRSVVFANDMELDVTGMAEAAAHAVPVKLPGGAEVPVASLAAQSVLKLVAWRHRGTINHRKDAQDLRLIFEAASSGAYADAVWDDASLETYDYDLALVGAHRLGRDAAALLDRPTQDRVAAGISSDEDRDRLVRAMARLHSDELLDAYVQGFRENR